LPFAVCAIAVAQGNDEARQATLRQQAESYAMPFANLINQHASVYGVDPALVVSVIAVESKGDPNASSYAGAMGLMQLMPATCLDYGVDDPFNPNSNIRGGTAVLASHLRRFKGNLEKVLAAYNAGPGRVLDGSWTRIRQTRRYVPAVLAYYAALNPSGNGLLSGSTGEVPGSQPLPPVPTIPALPPVRYLDGMFDIVYAAQIQVEPSGVAENGALSEAATVVLADLIDGKIKPENLQAKALKEAKKAGFKAKSLRAYALTTPDAQTFAEDWERQPKAPGGFVGIAHSNQGSSGNKHVWVVFVASK
jgi:hypothetical protein